MRGIVLFSLAALICTGCGDRRPMATRSPLFDGMGTHARAITTTSADAQRFFNQALVWTFAFNHDEAIRLYTQAAELDPAAAMPWWGIALCNGPHINNPIVDAAHASSAWNAIQEARKRRSAAGPVEQALIDALAQRYSPTPLPDGKVREREYADAMRRVWAANPRDPDIGTLFAESLMDLRPWDLWKKDGSPQAETTEIVETLERVLALAPNHPGALHLYIHAVEASPDPARAMDEADRLRNLVPGSGHLVHMPAHIDVRTGRWAAASEANVRAAEADRRYRALSPRQGFYRVYMAHNHHFLAFASMMEGRFAVARKAARDMIAGVPQEFLSESAALIDGVMSIELDVLKRFGKWDELLAQPAPAANLPITTAMWRFSRGIAHAAKGDVAAAKREQEQFRKAVAALPEGAMMSINPARNVLAVGEDMLAGEIEYRAGNIDAAVALLRAAVAKEDQLTYMEPPEWIQPVRHALGAVLLAEGRAKEAEAVYREDLKKLPDNGWSLNGLASSLRKQGRAAEAEQVEARFKKAWTRSDTPIATSCLCVK
jgi:tetratricopeptide (TPR) repeat protein